MTINEWIYRILDVHELVSQANPEMTINKWIYRILDVHEPVSPTNPEMYSILGHLETDQKRLQGHFESSKNDCKIKQFALLLQGSLHYMKNCWCILQHQCLKSLSHFWILSFFVKIDKTSYTLSILNQAIWIIFALSEVFHKDV